jgi:hypothetical protein
MGPQDRGDAIATAVAITPHTTSPARADKTRGRKCFVPNDRTFEVFELGTSTEVCVRANARIERYGEGGRDAEEEVRWSGEGEARGRVSGSRKPQLCNT